MHLPRRFSLSTCLRALACGALAVAALTGCGGGDDEDPLAPCRTQTVRWAACEPTIFGADTDKLRQTWQRLGDRLQCAYVASIKAGTWLDTALGAAQTAQAGAPRRPGAAASG